VCEIEWAWRVEWWQIYRRYELKNLKGETAFKSFMCVCLTEYNMDFCYIQRLCQHLGLQCHVRELLSLLWFDCDDGDDDNNINNNLLSVQSTHLVCLYGCSVNLSFPAVHTFFCSYYLIRLSSTRYAVSLTKFL